MRAFRKLALAQPLLIELREWSRMTEDLTAERNRLANRMRESSFGASRLRSTLKMGLQQNGSSSFGSLSPRPTNRRACEKVRSPNS
jgi:hypothetical protein